MFAEKGFHFISANVVAILRIVYLILDNGNAFPENCLGRNICRTTELIDSNK